VSNPCNKESLGISELKSCNNDLDRGRRRVLVRRVESGNGGEKREERYKFSTSQREEEIKNLRR